MLIKQALKYIIKTNWKQMRADYGRWQSLRGACRQMYKEVDDEESKIRTVFANFPYDGSRSCLNYVYSHSPDSDIKCAILPCKYFDDLHECPEAQCKYHTNNSRYVARNGQYATVRDMKRKFWAETFANVK